MCPKWLGLVLVVAAAQASPQALPPRSAGDITALLESYEPDAHAVAALKAELDRPPPLEDALKSAVLSYWDRRAGTAEALGLFSTQLDARRRLVTLSQGQASHGMYLHTLTFLEVWTGNRAEGLRLTYQQLDSASTALKAQNDIRLAMLLAEQGDVEAAQHHLRRGETGAQLSLTNSTNARWYANLIHSAIEAGRGVVFAARGRLPEAEGAYLRTIKLLQNDLEIAPSRTMQLAGAPPTEHIHFLIDAQVVRLVEAYVQQGRYVDAEILLRDRLSTNLKRVGRNAPNTLYIVHALAAVYAEQGRFPDAAALARIARDGLLKAGVPTESGYLLDLRLTFAKAHIGQEQWRQAVAEFELIQKAARGAAAGHRAASGSPEIAIALVRAGEAGSALRMMRVIVERLESNLGVDHYRTGEAWGVLAMALAKSGDRHEALQAFRHALAKMLEFEAQADEALSGGLRRLKLVWIVEAYLELLAEMHRAGNTEAAKEAFLVADVARSQRVQRAVTSSAVRASAETPELSALVRKEQDLGHEIASLYKFLGEQLMRPAEQQLPKVMAEMRTRIERIAGERFVLLRAIEKRFPAYANLVSPKPPTLAATRQALREGEAVVALYSGEETTYLWATRSEGDLVFASVPIARRELQARISRLLEGVKVTSVYIDALPKFDAALAHELYKLLLDPVVAGWTGSKSLLVVPHGPSAALSFSVLPTSAVEVGSASALLFAQYRAFPWLVRVAAVTQLPSTNALVTLRAQAPARAGRIAFAGFGDPIFSAERPPARAEANLVSRGITLAVRSAARTGALASARLANLPRLPDTADEIRSLAHLLGMPEGEGVFLDRRANEKEVKTRSLSDRRILAFATHGLVAGDLDGLTQPALALTAPEVAGVDGDGLLTLEEVLALKLDADWVILSACNTAAGEGAGAEAVSGLGRAFFYAGSRALLVSHWPVETVSAKMLTTGTIERYAKSSATRAEALRQSILEVLDRGEARDTGGKPMYSYAHPLFWAPFSVIGDGN